MEDLPLRRAGNRGPRHSQPKTIKDSFFADTWGKQVYSQRALVASTLTSFGDYILCIIYKISTMLPVQEEKVILKYIVVTQCMELSYGSIIYLHIQFSARKKWQIVWKKHGQCEERILLLGIIPVVEFVLIIQSCTSIQWTKNSALCQFKKKGALIKQLLTTVLAWTQSFLLMIFFFIGRIKNSLC